MQYRKPKKKKPLPARHKLAALLVVATALFLWADHLIRPAVETFVSYQSRVVSTEVINAAVLDALDAQQLQYGDLVQVTQDTSGRVCSVQANAAAINYLKAALTEAVSHRLQALQHETIDIPVGTLMGLQFLTGRGPIIPFEIEPASYVESRIESTLEAAAINQTRHCISICLRVEMAAVLPGYTTVVEVETNVALAETLLVGDVPSAYALLSGLISENVT